MYREAHTPLLFSAFDGSVTAYARTTGDVAWTFRVPDGQMDYRLFTRIAATDRYVVIVAARMNESGFFASADGTAQLYCLDYATGRRIWNQAVTAGTNIAHFTATLLVDGEQVFLAHGSVLAVYALATGAPQWQRPLERVKGGPSVTPVALAVSGNAEQADAR